MPTATAAWTIDDVLRGLPGGGVPPLPAPTYRPRPDWTAKAFLGIASFQRHTSDEGWQLQVGMKAAGFNLWGRGFPSGDETNVRDIINQIRPGTVIVQDKREWDPTNKGCIDKREAFQGVEHLERLGIFRLTVLKDAHQQPAYHRQAAAEIGCHAWVVYYHPRIVAHLAPYVRPAHLLRTYHALDPNRVPPYSGGRAGVLLSGAVSSAYPLRQRLFRDAKHLPECRVMKHPGYRAAGTHSPRFLEVLSKHKVAICTASRYGYALRKIMEATACGCRVLTDLPADEILPEIDGNLVRVHPQTPTAEIAAVLRKMLVQYDAAQQIEWAERARAFYDYRETTRRLASEIEALRVSYGRK